MKKQLIFFIVTAFCFYEGRSQDKGIPYDYPVKPGTREWRSLKSHDEMVKACQLPLNSIRSLKTSDLLQTCLTYPLSMDLMAFSNLKDGFAKTFNDFNGYQELKTRSDIGSAFLEMFSKISLDEINVQPNNTLKGNFTILVSLMEIMASDDRILSKLSSKQQISLSKKVLDNMPLKEKYSEHFGTLGKYTSAFLLANILVSREKVTLKVDDKIIQFANTMQLSNEKTIDDIVRYSKND